MGVMQQQNTDKKSKKSLNESGVSKDKGFKKSMLIKRVIALFLILFSCCALMTEVLLFGMYILPTFCVQLFQTTGIQIEAGLLISKFSVQDACVMFMMWIVPCVFIIGISIYGHCKLIKLVMWRVMAWFRLLFSKNK